MFITTVANIRQHRGRLVPSYGCLLHMFNKPHSCHGATGSARAKR